MKVRFTNKWDDKKTDLMAKTLLGQTQMIILFTTFRLIREGLGDNIIIELMDIIISVYTLFYVLSSLIISYVYFVKYKRRGDKNV